MALVHFPAAIGDAEAVAHLIRDADRVEVKAQSGLSVESAILNSILNSEAAFYITNRWKQPVALCGVTRISTLWMVSTTMMEQHRYEFARRSIQWIEMFHRSHEMLWNEVHTKNEDSIRWLKWLGFKMYWGDKRVYRGETFIPFVSRRETNVHCINRHRRSSGYSERGVVGGGDRGDPVRSIPAS